LGEYQADKLFAAEGHQKLNHEGKLVGLLDPPRGPGLDGVWRNATPPPEYLITETKYNTSSLSRGQMSEQWVLSDNRLEQAVGPDKAIEIRKALFNDNVGKRLLQIDAMGNMQVQGINRAGGLFDL
jgi:hypothetical protein